MIKIALVLVLAVLVAGCTQNTSLTDSTQPRDDGSNVPQTDDTAMMEKTGDAMMDATEDAMAKEEDAMIAKETDAMMEKSEASYTGEVIAGSNTPYIRFSRADFDTAVNAGKAVYVYYYATWCPICASERPHILDAFNTMDIPGTIGFEAHWNDGQNTPDDEAFAREFGVSYQHTHLFFKNGQLVEKTLESLSAMQIQEKLAALV